MFPRRCTEQSRAESTLNTVEYKTTVVSNTKAHCMKAAYMKAYSTKACTADSLTAGTNTGMSKVGSIAVRRAYLH